MILSSVKAYQIQLAHESHESTRMKSKMSKGALKSGRHLPRAISPFFILKFAFIRVMSDVAIARYAGCDCIVTAKLRVTSLADAGIFVAARMWAKEIVVRPVNAEWTNQD